MTAGAGTSYTTQPFINMEAVNNAMSAVSGSMVGVDPIQLDIGVLLKCFSKPE